MSDQGKWFKLWCSALRDDDLENLSIHEWFAWVRLGAHIKENGKNGKIRLRYPGTAVVNLLRVETFEEAVNMIKRFPNCAIEEGKSVTANVTVASVTYEIEFLNWSKFQGDFSGDRVKRHRTRVTANVTAQEERRREEKRGDVEEKRLTPLLTPPKSGGNTDPKPYERPNRETDPVGHLVMVYKLAKGYPFDDRVFDRKWGRWAKAAKQLLEDCHDVGVAERFITKYAALRKDAAFEWTLETIMNKAHELRVARGKHEHVNSGGARIPVSGSHAGTATSYPRGGGLVGSDKVLERIGYQKTPEPLPKPAS